ncbi:MAG TPA: hypothetical protein VJC08_02265 [bacterium]|nr:hypothetical protein [bacterium]
MEKTKFCPAVWLSGFFALGALVHFLRFVFGATLVVAGYEIPMTASVALFVVLGALSVGAFVLGLKKPFCKSEHKEKNQSGGGCCGHSH